MCDGLVGFQGLVCWIVLWCWEVIVEGVVIEDEEFYVGIVIVFVEVCVVGCVFVVELVYCWQCCVMGEMLFVVEYCCQYVVGGGMFDGLVEFVVQVGCGEMYVVIGGVGIWVDCGGIGGLYV